MKRERAAALERLRKHEQCAEQFAKLAQATRGYSEALDALESSFLSRPFQGRDFSKAHVRVEPKR